MSLPDAERRALLEAFYQYTIAPESEKASAKKSLDEMLDCIAAGVGLSRRDVKDFVRAELFPDYYRRRRVEDRGHL
jgi:hypothetical protein